jgi:hypothetical protein
MRVKVDKVTSAAVSISLDGSDEELRLLADWLRGEDPLRGRVTMIGRPIPAGEMGGVLDAVQVVLNSGTATALVPALFAWRHHRRSASKVTLKVRGDRGREIELTCGSADDAQDVLRQITTVLDNGR